MKIQRGQAVILSKSSSVWYDKSDDEIAAQYASDAAAGRFMDSAGEPIIHSRVGSMMLDRDVTAIVTKTKGLIWRHWIRRPKGLVEGLITISGIPRYVMFKKDSVLGVGS